MKEQFNPITLSQALALETAVWQALQTGDADADRALLAADFLGVYPSGFAGRAEHAGQLATGPSVDHFTLSEARLMEMGPDHFLLAYRADYSRKGQRGTMYVASLWRWHDGRWQNIFSQDTPADADLALP